MQCSNHSDREAIRTCSICDKPLCKGCAKKIKNDFYYTQNDIFACRGLCARKARARLRRERFEKATPSEWFFGAAYLLLGLANVVWTPAADHLNLGVLFISLGLLHLATNAFNLTKLSYAYKRSFAAFAGISMALVWIVLHVRGAFFMLYLMIALVVIIAAIEIRDTVQGAYDDPIDKNKGTLS